MANSPRKTIAYAAQIMRARAEAANRGPWAATKTADRSLINYDVWGWTEHEQDYGEPLALDVGQNNALHMASWHPLVALAVAAWLESWAEVEVSEHGPHTDDWAHALKIARAYFGDDEGEDDEPEFRGDGYGTYHYRITPIRSEAEGDPDE